MSTEARSAPGAVIDPATTVGAVRLTVSDLARSRSFYEQVLGLRASEREDGALAVSVPGGPVLAELFGDASASALDRRATGLFHFAVLFPDRRELAFALARLAQARWPLDGASDHLVSEALYLSDPDGHGIELYRDRPREQWRYENGALQMATLPLDLRGLLGELDGESALPASMSPGTRMGHIHLQVSELRETENFYSGVLGFDVMVRDYPGALFVSAGGYHHHLGLNTWNSAGSRPLAPGSIALRSFDIALPDEAARDAVLERVRAAGLEPEPGPAGPILRDPSGNRVELRVA